MNEFAELLKNLDRNRLGLSKLNQDANEELENWTCKNDSKLVIIENYFFYFTFAEKLKYRENRSKLGLKIVRWIPLKKQYQNKNSQRFSEFRHNSSVESPFRLF